MISATRSRSSWGSSLSDSKPLPSTNSVTITRSCDIDVTTSGHHDERVAAQDARERALVVGLQLVVELLLHPRADLLGHRLHVELGGDPPHQPQDHAEVLHVGAHRGVHARVLHLHRHVAAVVQLRAVDLPDRGGGDRLLVELREGLLQRLAHLLLDHLAHVLEGHLRRGVAQLGELLLELLAVLLGHQARRRGTTAPGRASSRRPSSCRAPPRSARPSPRGASRARAVEASSERTTFAVLVPACFTAEDAAARPTFASRRYRPVGMPLSATAVAH